MAMSPTPSVSVIFAPIRASLLREMLAPAAVVAVAKVAAIPASMLTVLVALLTVKEPRLSLAPPPIAPVYVASNVYVPFGIVKLLTSRARHPTAGMQRFPG